LGLLSSVKKHLTIQLVGVLLLEDRCDVYVTKVKKSSIIDSEKKSFDIESKENLSKELVTYLNNLQEEYEQTYIALFLNTLGQGAISGCNSEAYEKFDIDKKNVKSVCIDNQYTFYASLIDIKWVNKIFYKVGLDFIFSPFLVLKKLMNKEMIAEDDVVLNILYTNNGLTMMIMKGDKFLYGSFFNLAKDEDLLYDEFDSSSESMEELDSDFLEEFDLDESNDDINQIQDFTDMDDLTSEGQLSQKDLRFMKYLDASLKEFYHSEKYESSFVSFVKIYDASGINEYVIKHIENELLVDTSLVSVDILKVLVEIAEEEVLTNA
jgi:hypothetical protein